LEEKTIDEKIISQLKRGIAFVCVEKSSVYEEIGTGFFCQVPLEDLPTQAHTFFVTAKHILKNEDGFYEKIFLRLNSKEGEISYFELPIKDKIIFHEDQTVDLAVIPCFPNRETYDYTLLPGDKLGDKDLLEKFKVIEGDDVFFAGLFLAHRGHHKNTPIFRYGKIALITDDKISWTSHEYDIPQLSQLYLIDCHTFDGNSGSPVFILPKPKLKENEWTQGPIQPIFGGVIRGSFTEKNETGEGQNYYENQGITAVTPGHKLKEILFSKNMVKQRKEISEKNKNKVNN